MKVSWRTEIPFWLLILAMFALALSAWPGAPDSLPVHWGVDGHVDRYGSKFEGLLLFPLITVALYLMMLALPNIDPGRLNYARFAGAYMLLRLGVIGLGASWESYGRTGSSGSARRGRSPARPRGFGPTGSEAGSCWSGELR
jgi:hypothetical protein